MHTLQLNVALVAILVAAVARLRLR